MIATPRDAASVILVSDGGPAEQALLIRRHASLSFAGDTWVFPGGKLEPADEAAAARGGVVLPDRLPGSACAPASRARTLALIVAACRETFEETGIVLAHPARGGDCPPELASSLQELRPGVSKVPWSHWITPSLAPKRFDTRFFVALMPPAQSARCDSVEATEILWLDLRAADVIPDASPRLAPPTRISLAELKAALREHGNAQRLMQLEAQRDVMPILPKLLREDGHVTVLLPWDPQYAATPGDGVPVDARCAARYIAFPSRLRPAAPAS